MNPRMDKIRLAIKYAPMTLRDSIFSFACKVLLPLSTNCKVCNMLRGMAMGLFLGMAFASIVLFPFILHWLGY